MPSFNKEKLNREISGRLNASLGIKGLRKSYVARDLELSPNTVGDYFSGKVQAPVWFLVAICQTYGVNIEWLIAGEGSPERKTQPEDKKLDQMLEYIRNDDVAMDLLLDEIRKNQDIFREVATIGISKIEGLFDKMKSLIMAKEIQERYRKDD